MTHAPDRASFAEACDRYSLLHDAHLKKLRLAALVGYSFDIGTFGAEADEIKHARDTLYHRVRPFLVSGDSLPSTQHDDKPEPSG